MTVFFDFLVKLEIRNEKEKTFELIKEFGEKGEIYVMDKEVKIVYGGVAVYIKTDMSTDFVKIETSNYEDLMRVLKAIQKVIGYIGNDNVRVEDE